MIEEETQPRAVEPLAAPEQDPEPPTGPLARAYAWIAVWLSPLLVLAVAAAAVASWKLLPSLAEEPTATMSALLPSNPRALEVQRESAQRFGLPLLTPYAVVQRNPHGLSLPVERATIRKALDVYRQRGPVDLRGAVGVPVFNSLRLFPGSHEHGTTVITYLFFRPPDSAAHDYTVSERYAAFLGPKLDTIGETGAIPARIQQYRVLDSRLRWTEGATVALILLIVGIAFRAVLAPLITVLTAGVAFLISQHVLGYVAVRTGLTMPNELTAVAVALMLGIVTDYSVFFLAGTRQRLRAGDSRTEAVRRTTATNTPIVVAAGLVVAVGVASLMLGTLGFFRAFGPGMAITVATGLLVSITLVPALLALLGRAAFWPGLARGPVEVRQWRRRLARLTTTKTVSLLLVVAVVAVLGFLAAGLRNWGLGLALVRGLPSDNVVARAADAAAKGFAPGALAPTELDLQAPGLVRRRGALAQLQDELRREPGVAAVLGPADQPGGRRLGLALAPRADAARYLLVLDSDPTEAPALQHLSRIQSDLPALLRRVGLGGAQAGWAGETALGVETVQATQTSLWRVMLAALGVNFVFLVILLRSLLAPLYLLAASVLALAATMGLTLTFFRDALGDAGLPYYLPVAFSVLLLSLGSDYNVFVVGRIWQEAERRPLREAVAYAAPRAGRAIMVAGLALALSFALLAIVPIEPFAVMAFAMATGILIDALLVRTVLVPGLIVLLGRGRSWPRRLREP